MASPCLQVRVSVGIDDPESLMAVFEKALAHACGDGDSEEKRAAADWDSDSESDSGSCDMGLPSPASIVGSP